MLEQLRFVQGSVSKRDLAPYLTHFVIEGGMVRGFNGTVALGSPLPFELSCKPKAAPMIQAIAKCDETVQLGLTPSGKLSVKSGKFTAYVECVQEETAHVLPEGKIYDFECPNFVKALEKVITFVGTDAARAWATGVLISGQSMFATNNTCCIEYWLGPNNLPTICIPRVAVKELIRIDEQPVKIQIGATSVTFHYHTGCWLRTQLIEAKWPDITRILDVATTPTAIEDRIFHAVETLKPFMKSDQKAIRFSDGYATIGQLGEEATNYALEGLGWAGMYNADMFLMLKGIAKTADFTKYPAPAMFFGDRLRGAIIGMKDVAV